MHCGGDYTYGAEEDYTKRCYIEVLIFNVGLSIDQGLLNNYPTQAVCDEDNRSCLKTTHSSQLEPVQQTTRVFGDSSSRTVKAGVRVVSEKKDPGMG